jgi:starch synthase
MEKISLKQVKKIFPRKRKLRILFVSSEAAPFAKAGGLGDVVCSLSFALKELGQDPRILIPFYGTIDKEKFNFSDEIKKLKVPTDQPGNDPFLVCAIKKYSGNKSVTSYFLENMEYYEKRANVYGYGDDHVRWALLCRGAIEWIKKSSWKPDIIIASDWQTGLIPDYLHNKYQLKIPTVFVIHNLRYQGMCDFRFVPEEELDNGETEIPDFFNPALAKLNWLLRGVLHSEKIITVSPKYAEEILTPEFGEGLDYLFIKRKDDLIGILNGINQEEYCPGKSPLIPFKYNVKKIINKKNNKKFLQEKFNLPQSPDSFLIAVVSRFTEQKGFDLLEKIGPDLLKNLDIQIIFLGDGETRYKQMIKDLSDQFPDKVKSLLEFDSELPHLVFSGADSLLMPSKFEPCGITQMQAMKYGCVPIVRRTGGLASTVQDFNPKKNIGDGFVFDNYDHLALYATIVRAYSFFQSKNIWNKIMKRAMKKDFSWKHSAKKYLTLFNETLKNKNVLD